MPDARTPRVYLSLRCDLACAYCSNGKDIRWDEADELNADAWLKRFAKLPGDELVFTGGEPTLHAGFLDIITRCPKDMWIYSNFARDLDVPLGLRIHWRASCHATTSQEAARWLRRVSDMHEKGYKMTCTVVKGTVKGDAMARLHDHNIIVDDVQKSPEPLDGPVLCRLPRILIAPDGMRYHCVSKLVRHDFSGIVGLHGGDDLVCHDGTRCVPCDSLASERKRIA